MPHFQVRVRADQRRRAREEKVYKTVGDHCDFDHNFDPDGDFQDLNDLAKTCTQITARSQDEERSILKKRIYI